MPGKEKDVSRKEAVTAAEIEEAAVWLSGYTLKASADALARGAGPRHTAAR